jgi:hypothetical protein
VTDASHSLFNQVGALLNDDSRRDLIFSWVIYFISIYEVTDSVPLQFSLVRADWCDDKMCLAMLFSALLIRR